MSTLSFVGKSLIVLALAVCVPAQLGGVASASGASSGQVNHGPQYDPNMPPPGDMNAPGLPLYWAYLYSSTLPRVYFRKTGEFCVYLGFNEKGSYMQNQGDGKVYLWNLSGKSLTPVADNFKNVPLDVLASLKNTDPTVQAWLAANDKSHQTAGNSHQQGGATSSSGAVNAQSYRGPEYDPNMPPVISQNNTPLYWTYSSGTVPSVQFKGYPFSTDPHNQADGVYLGFNGNGSLILNQGNLKLYYWRLTTPNNFVLAGSLTQTLALKSAKDIPLDLLASLQNPSPTVTERLGTNDKPAQPATVPQQQPARNPDRSAGLSGAGTQQALQSLVPAAGSPANIAGNNANIKDGVLTFTLADGTRSKPYTVVRPGFMANAPQAAGASGTWIAMETGGKGMMFTVTCDLSAHGRYRSL